MSKEELLKELRKKYGGIKITENFIEQYLSNPFRTVLRRKYNKSKKENS